MGDSVDTTQLTGEINTLKSTLATIDVEHKKLIRRVNRLDNPIILQETSDAEHFKVSLERVDGATYYTVTRETDHYDAETGQWVLPRTAKIKWTYTGEYPNQKLDMDTTNGLPKFEDSTEEPLYPTIQRADTDLYFKDGIVKTVGEWTAADETIPAHYQPVYTWRTAEGADILYNIGSKSAGMSIMTPSNKAIDYGKINAVYPIVSGKYAAVEVIDTSGTTFGENMVFDDAMNPHWYRLDLNGLSDELRKIMVELMNSLNYNKYFRHTPSGLYTLAYDKDGNPFIPEDSGETLVQYKLESIPIQSLEGCTAVPFGEKVIEEWRIIPRTGTVFASNGNDSAILATIVDSINDGAFYLEMNATDDPNGPKLITEAPMTMHISTGPSDVYSSSMNAGQGVMFGVNNPTRAGWINYGGSLGNINSTTINTITATSQGFQYALKIGDDWIIDELPTQQNPKPTRDYRIFYFIDIDHAAAQFGERAATRKPFLIYSRSPKELCIEDVPL